MEERWILVGVFALLVGFVAVRYLARWMDLRRRMRAASAFEKWATDAVAAPPVDAEPSDAERRIRELQDAVATVCRERDDWQSFYYQASVGAGQAQQMMLAERARLVHQLHKLGAKPKLDARIDKVVEDFKGHVDAAARGGRPPESLSGPEHRLGGARAPAPPAAASGSSDAGAA